MTVALKRTGEILEKTLNKIIILLEKYYYVFFALLCASVAFFCFYNLGEWRVMDWDEARHAVSGYEMYKNNEYLINTYNYVNDYWNLKPPLSFLCIVFSFKLFGCSVFSMRLYSAVSMVLTAVFTGIYSQKRYGKLASLAVLAVLCACTPLYNSHCARHGDADSLFILFFSLAIMLATTKRFFWCSGLCFSFAFLAKSWHAGCVLLIVGIYFIYLVVKKQAPGKKQIMGYIASLIVPILLWAIMRFVADGPKFLKDMITYDLLKRTAQGVEDHNMPPLFYVDFLFEIIPWLLLGINALLIVSVFLMRDSFVKAKKEVFFLTLWGGLPFVLFSIVKTKLYWYVLPCLIPMAIAAGVLLAKLVKSKKVKIYVKIIFIVTFGLIIFNSTKTFVAYLSNPTTSPIQDFISENAHLARGKTAYYEEIDAKGTTVMVWSQSNTFVAEISGDLHCAYGGVNKFIKLGESGCCIFMDTETYNQNDLGDTSLYKVCAQNEEYVMLLLN